MKIFFYFILLVRLALAEFVGDKNLNLYEKRMQSGFETLKNPFSNMKDEIFNQLLDILLSHSNTSIIFVDVLQNKACNESIYNMMANSSTIYEVINSSGKGLSDIGLEDDCEEEGFHYLFLEYQLNTTIFFNNTEYLYLYRFLEQTSFFQGLCVLKECTGLYTRFFDRNENKVFYDYLNESFGITEIINYSNKPAKENPAVKVIIYIVLAYALAKIIVSIVGFAIHKIYEDEMTEEEKNERRENEFNQNPTLTSEERTFGTSISNSDCFLNKRKAKFTKLKLVFHQIYKFMSIKSDIKCLYSIKNKYYDDTGLEYISFFRIFILFWLIFNHNIFALVKIPHRDFTNYSFFTSIWFTIIKYSSFASECWVLLDGLITSYKLMSYLKKNNENKTYAGYGICVFLRFYVMTVTQIFLFLFSFFVVHVYLEDFAKFLKDTPIMQYFIDNINNKRMCQIKPELIFIPFYIQYFTSEEDPTIGFNNCYRFVNIVMNEFYSFTIVMIIFYLAYRLKSRIFDYSISIIFIVNLCLSFLSYENHREGEIYSFSWILGDTKGHTYTHLFINSYVMGIFTGMVYFFYNDVISANPLATYQVDNYMPFDFTFSLMKFFDTSGNGMKSFYFFLSISLQILLSTSFYWYVLIFNTNPGMNGPEYDFNIKINSTIFFAFIYERKLFLIFFIIMLLSVLIYPKVTSMKLFVQSNIFAPYNRTFFACLCIVDTCVYLFYSAYNIQIYLNLQNMFLITSGLIVIISFFAVLFWCLFELPFRILFKRLLKKEAPNE